MEVLDVQPRSALGKRNSRKLRGTGQLPAVLYGHGEEPVHLTIDSDQMANSLRHGAKVVTLQGAAAGQALLQQVQWDIFYQSILHVDLLRVDADEKVVIEVPIELRGDAPGSHQGGVVEQLRHSIHLETSPGAIPDKLHININHLELNDTLNANDIEDLPEGAKITDDIERTIVQCVAPTKARDSDEEEAAPSEPEVIGQKPEEEEGDK